jgi:GT2 family glycosyltransferase
MSQNHDVTIAVVPRERFSFARESLEALLRHTDLPFHLIYVDGGSPPRVRRYLERRARATGFDLLRSDGYLTPNRARNLARARIDTKYVVFMDNDVVASPGWLPSLRRCAEETNASVVSPLICEGLPLHSTIHFAGGDTHVDVVEQQGHVERHLVESIYRQGQRLADVRHELHRTRTNLAEFHCVMIRASVLDSVGPFDEALLSVRENVDFCLVVAENGGTLYLEPASVVTYAGYLPLRLSDIPYYLLRWNNGWTLDTLHHLRDKWRLTEDEYFQRQYTEQFLEWRRREFLIHASLLRWVPSWKLRNALDLGLSPLLSWAADVTAASHAKRPERVRLVQPYTDSQAAEHEPSWISLRRVRSRS